MTTRRSIVRLFAFVFVAGICALSSPARGDTPSPIQSHADANIIGTVSGQFFDGTTEYQYHTRMLDINRTPIPNRLVWIDFSQTSIRLYGVQNSGTTLNCATRTLSKLTDAQGWANFAPRFGGFENSNKVEVVNEGVVLALVPARSVDIDAADGLVSLADFSHYATAYLSVQPHREVNFNQSVSDIPDLSDYSIFADQYLRSAIGSYCP